jgi:Transmembrane family, TMEM144 of transporters
VSIFDGCSDSCGRTAGIMAALAYGSFGVPIKQTKHIDVHPLVFQSYKTLTMFLMSWLVIFMGVSPAWTPWGLLSGFLWVMGGTGGVYAIRLAGLAIAVGTWASVMICVNFVWGILIFREPVADIGRTASAFLLLTLGLVGMSHYSAPQAPEHKQQDGDAPQESTPALEDEGRSIVQPNPNYGSDLENTMTNSSSSFSMFIEKGEQKENSDLVTLCGVRMTKRIAGIWGAVFNGIMTGSSLIPLHYAKEQGFGGARYMISLASGAFIANSLIWVCFFGVVYVQQRRLDLPGPKLLQAYDSMPKWYFEKLILPGICAGKGNQRPTGSWRFRTLTFLLYVSRRREQVYC